MNANLLSEIIGAIAAILVLISYTFKDQRKLRIFGIIAGAVFTLYGFQIAYFSDWVNGWSTVALNIACIVVNAIRLKRT